MDQTRSSASSEVRIGHSLNEAEEQYLKKRTNTVLECLKQHKISCSEDKVPKIAVLGSGGGLRAMIGLLGSLSQLHKEELLDSVMYLGGVSGSTCSMQDYGSTTFGTIEAYLDHVTRYGGEIKECRNSLSLRLWNERVLFVYGERGCMASLYKQPDWSTKLENMKEDIIERLANGSVTSLEMAKKLVKYYSSKDTFSLTDVWAALIVSSMVKEIDGHHLTEQRGQHANDPYPIYTVIDKQSKYDRLNKDECGYSLTGAFVDSSCFESQFENGKMSNKQPENDMLYLQGLCGSAIADIEEILKKLWESLRQLINAQMEASQESLTEDHQKGCQTLSELVELNLCVLRGEDPSAHLKTLNNLIKDKCGEKGQIREDVTLTKKELEDETLDICRRFIDWFSIDWDVIWIAIVRAIEEIVQWYWGSTYNYLYKMAVKEVHTSILSSEKREYEDAGELLNSPYFSVLRKERDIDLVISLDFSKGDPFETVVHTAKTCKELQIPFPEVVVPAADTEPQDFYVFRGYTKAPTVIHMPLFNCVNCKGEIEKWEKKYSTFNQSYSHSDIEALLDKAALNIKNNKEKLLTEIKHIIDIC